MTPEHEEWRDIPGYEGYYQASDQGRIRSLDRVIYRRDGIVSNKPGRVLKQFFDKRYMKVKLYVPGRPAKTPRVHTLVMRAFYGQRPKGLVICHYDGDPTNNSLDNLRFGTCADNMADMIRHGTNHNASKTHCKRGHEFNEQNTRILRKGGRECLPCKRFLSKRYREARKSAAA